MKKKILIIEDDEETLSILDYLVKDHSPHLEVINSTTVLPVDYIRSLSPDLILLDHWVGNDLGGELCLKLKSTPDTKDIPVILFSGIIEIHHLAVHCRPDAYIPKPIDLYELTSLIEKFVPGAI